VIGETTRSGQPRQQALLFEKQQQKTLVNLAIGGFTSTAP
jgi:hypothetical protein